MIYELILLIPSLSNLQISRSEDSSRTENLTNVYSLLNKMNTTVPLVKDEDEVNLLNDTEVRGFVLVNMTEVDLNKTIDGIKISNVTSNIIEKGDSFKERSIQKRSVNDQNIGSLHISRTDNDVLLLDQQNVHFNKSLTHAM